MKKRYAALVLATVLLLSGCGGSRNMASDGLEPTQTPSDVGKSSMDSVSCKIGEPFIQTGVFGLGNENKCTVRFSVPVTNNGTADLFLRSASFDFLDAQGNAVGMAEHVRCSPDVLAPGETGWYCELGMADVLPGEVAAIVPHIDPQRSPYLPIRLSVTDLTYNEENMPEHGTVLNDSTYSLPNTIFCTALFFDAKGNVFYRIEGVTARLEPGESKQVFFGGGMLTDDLRPYYDHCEIIAYPDASSNAIRADG